MAIAGGSAPCLWVQLYFEPTGQKVGVIYHGENRLIRTQIEDPETKKKKLVPTGACVLGEYEIMKRLNSGDRIWVQAKTFHEIARGMGLHRTYHSNIDGPTIARLIPVSGHD